MTIYSQDHAKYNVSVITDDADYIYTKSKSKSKDNMKTLILPSLPSSQWFTITKKCPRKQDQAQQRIESIH